MRLIIFSFIDRFNDKYKSVFLTFRSRALDFWVSQASSATAKTSWYILNEKRKWDFSKSLQTSCFICLLYSLCKTLNSIYSKTYFSDLEHYRTHPTRWSYEQIQENFLSKRVFWFYIISSWVHQLFSKCAYLWDTGEENLE